MPAPADIICIECLNCSSIGRKGFRYNSTRRNHVTFAATKDRPSTSAAFLHSASAYDAAILLSHCITYERLSADRTTLTRGMRARAIDAVL